MWKALHLAIDTMANLFKQRSSTSPLCPLCNLHEESVEHIFLLCPWVKLVWFGGVLNFNINREDKTTWANWLLAISGSFNGSKHDLRRKMSYIAFKCWQIQKARCNTLFSHQPINLEQVMASISTMVRAFTEASCPLVISYLPYGPLDPTLLGVHKNQRGCQLGDDYEIGFCRCSGVGLGG